MSAQGSSQLAAVPGETVPTAVPVLLALVGAGLAFVATQQLITPRAPTPAPATRRLATKPKARPAVTPKPKPAVTPKAKPAVTPKAKPAVTPKAKPAIAPKADPAVAPKATAKVCAPVFDVAFTTGATTPRDDIGEQAKQLATWMRAHPEAKLEVRGHADASGAEFGNFVLSKKRAVAVLKALGKGGLPAKRARVRAFGEFAPLSDKAASNRRVQLVVVGHPACSTNAKGKDAE